MVLIYVHKATSRVLYTMRLIFETILGIEWQLADDPVAYEKYQGARLCYGEETLSDNELFIKASGLLFERGIRDLVPTVANHKGLTILFPASDKRCMLGFDAFAAAFFLITRYEEYLPFVKDEFGRFEAKAGIAWKNGFLQTPVIDHYALLLKTKLMDKFPFLNFPERKFRHIPTIDVDVAYAYKGRGLLRTGYGTIKSLLESDLKSVRKRFRVLADKENDPYDTYDDLISAHKSYSLKAYYFFLCADYGPLDRNIAVFSKAFQLLVKKIGDYAYVGIHPSAVSNQNDKALTEEIKRLSSALNNTVTCSRQHYLMIRFPQTYQILIKNNISCDFSMGYASHPGFRAGTCTPYYHYDLDREVSTKLKVIPLTLMDGTLKDYLQLSPSEAVSLINDLIKAVKEVNGTFVSLWHNDAFSDHGQWKGWKKVYEEMLHLAAE